MGKKKLTTEEKLFKREHKPMNFSFYGGKVKIVPYYPTPKHKIIIEPFAGSAQYSFLYHDRDVLLIEKDPIQFGVLTYLKQVSEEEILNLPIIKIGDSLKNHTYLSRCAKNLIGFNLRRGTSRPNNYGDKRSSWSELHKKRIANNLYRTRNWDIILGDAFDMPIIKNATYFIDPPYMVESHGYTHRLSNEDYVKLKKIIENLIKIGAQVIVCGNESDTWLDFEPLKRMQGIGKKHTECVFLGNCK